jgi:MFS family permease
MLRFISGVVGDIWDAKTRGKAMLLFAASPFTGPAIGPVVSGWIAVGGASWRWLFWVLSMFVSLFIYFWILTADDPLFRPVSA